VHKGGRKTSIIIIIIFTESTAAESSNLGTVTGLEGATLALVMTSCSDHS